MELLLLEALGAMLLLVVIVWWTMFSGRCKGEIKSSTDQTPTLPMAEPESLAKLAKLADASRQDMAAGSTDRSSKG